MSETTEYRHENFMSDFDFILPLTDCRGTDLGWPDFDWEVGLWTTSQADMRRVGCRDGVPYGCFNDNGRVHVVLKDHGLRAGVLQARATAYLPNAIYPDGTQKRVRPSELTIELVRGAGDCPTATEVELMLPFIKGDKGDKMTYADLTAADKADLTEPIKEALEKDFEDINIVGTPTGEVIEDIEPTLVTDALRKVPQVLTPEEQAQVKDNLGISKIELFCDLWNAAWGQYGKYDPVNAPDPQHPFMGNKLWMTYEEALNIYEACVGINTIGSSKDGCFYRYPYRTVIPIEYRSQVNAANMFNGALNLEVVTFTDKDNIPFEVSRWDAMFNYCRKLHTVNGVLAVNKAQIIGQFYECRALREIRIRGIFKSLVITHSPLLSLASVAYMIAEAVNTTAITITVHPDVYAKLTDTANTEWYQVLLDALDKNITFATV